MAANQHDAVNTTDATPAITKPNEGSGNRLWQGIVRFLREVQIELKKTNWPTKNELTKFVIVVMVTIVVVSVYLAVSDAVVYAVFGKLFNLSASPAALPR